MGIMLLMEWCLFFLVFNPSYGFGELFVAVSQSQWSILKLWRWGCQKKESTAFCLKN